MELHQWLHQHLQARGWTPAQLAREAGCDRALIHRLVTGRRPRPEIWTMLRIVRALQLSAGALDELEEPSRRKSDARVE